MFYQTTTGPAGPAVIHLGSSSLRQLRRDVQLLLDDVRLVGVHQRDVRLRHGRVDLAHAHAAVLEVEEQVAAALEPLAGLGLLDGLVDADAPDARSRSGLERPEATAAGDLEEHLSALSDHVVGDRLALVRSDEVLRVVD